MLYSDEAIKTNQEDLLGRDKFAKFTAHTLLKMTYKGTYTVGLFGKWGSGKTSVLNMILEEMRAVENTSDSDNSRTIIIHFEPWNFSSTDQLLSQFFVRLINEFSSSSDKKLQTIASALESYAFAFDLAKVIPIFGDVVSSAAKKGISLFHKRITHGANEKDISSQRDNVIRMLEKQDKRLLIVIDDIDRLSNEQIRCVFQLVTSVAKFPKTTYLLAFDKRIVVKALEEVQKGRGEDYLEKIIQVPIQLPDIQNGMLMDVLFSRLDEVVLETPGLHFSSEYWQQLFPVCIKPFIKSLRDINRLCNALQFKMQAIAEEIDFTDMASITSLEINYPAIYEWILASKDILTGDYSARLIGSYNWKREDWEKITCDQWRAILERDGEKAVEMVTDAICVLFPAIGGKIKPFSSAGSLYNDDFLRSGNHVGHRDKFDRYFQLSLSGDSIPHSDVVNVTTLLSESELAYFLKEADKDGKSSRLLEEIEATVREISSDRAKVLVRALCSVSADFDQMPKAFLGLSAGRYAEDLLMKLLERIPENERFSLIEEIVQAASITTMETVAVLLNDVELAYGRLAANGRPQGYSKVLQENELNQFESLFTKRIKALLENENLLEFNNYRMTMYLLACFDGEYMQNYLQNLFSDARNILLYLPYSVSKWTGSDISYEVQDSYKTYLSDLQIVSAIEQCRNNGKLFELSEKVQLMSAVFWLYCDNKFDYSNHILEKSAKQLLDGWKE